MTKFLFLVLISFISPIADNIFSINTTKKNAEKFVSDKKYQEALKCYQTLVETYDIKEGNVLLNYANILLITQDTLKARGIYTKIISTIKTSTILSAAYSQAGYIEFSFNKNKDEAEKLLKLALITNDQNTVARQNLYLLLNHHSKTSNAHADSQAQENTTANKQNNDLKETSNNTQKGKEQLSNENFDKINISMERAKQLLDAMQKNELQYIHQLQNRNPKTENKNLPKW
jgi:hypothetical protein